MGGYPIPFSNTTLETSSKSRTKKVLFFLHPYLNLYLYQSSSVARGKITTKQQTADQDKDKDKDKDDLEMEGLSHEKLDVYQESLEFVRYVDLLINDLSSGDPAVKQLDRASDSISLNIAEGNGKFREKDRCSYFDTAKGSAFECASCLDLLVAKQLVEEEEVKKGKEMLQEIISMLIGLIRNNSDRAYEGQEEYVTQD